MNGRGRERKNSGYLWIDKRGIFFLFWMDRFLYFVRGDYFLGGAVGSVRGNKSKYSPSPITQSDGRRRLGSKILVSEIDFAFSFWCMINLNACQ